MEGLLVGWFLFGLLCGLLGLALGTTKGRGAEAFFLGFVLGPIGLIIAMLLPETGVVAPASRKHEENARSCPKMPLTSLRINLFSQDQKTESWDFPAKVRPVLPSAPQPAAFRRTWHEVLGSRLPCVFCVFLAVAGQLLTRVDGKS